MTKVELVISANGCKDDTASYLQTLPNVKVVWHDEPLGYARAVNEGLKVSTGHYVTLLNDDTVLLEQPKNQWLDLLELNNDGISCVVKNYSTAAKAWFAIFFCAMIRRDVFDKIGFLDEEFEVGGCEDIDFCKRAINAGYTVNEALPKFLQGDNYTGAFPIYHLGEGTVKNPKLVKNWTDVFYKNTLRLAKKYNTEHYKFLLSNNYERAVFLKGDEVFPREKARYVWASERAHHMIMEVGCSTGYGSQFLEGCYIGVDYDPIIIDVAKTQGWDGTFICSDIRELDFVKSDTIIAFEVIEHLDNGLEFAEFLKTKCDRLLISVPWNEPVGFWGEHHRLHGLNESHFPGFAFSYMDEFGNITDSPRPIDGVNHFNLMLGEWNA